MMQTKLSEWGLVKSADVEASPALSGQARVLDTVSKRILITESSEESDDDVEGSDEEEIHEVYSESDVDARKSRSVMQEEFRAPECGAVAAGNSPTKAISMSSVNDPLEEERAVQFPLVDVDLACVQELPMRLGMEDSEEAEALMGLSQVPKMSRPTSEQEEDGGRNLSGVSCGEADEEALFPTLRKSTRSRSPRKETGGQPELSESSQQRPHVREREPIRSVAIVPPPAIRRTPAVQAYDNYIRKLSQVQLVPDHGHVRTFEKKSPKKWK